MARANGNVKDGDALELLGSLGDAVVVAAAHALKLGVTEENVGDVDENCACVHVKESKFIHMGELWMELCWGWWRFVVGTCNEVCNGVDGNDKSDAVADERAKEPQQGSAALWPEAAEEKVDNDLGKGSGNGKANEAERLEGVVALAGLRWKGVCAIW